MTLQDKKRMCGGVFNPQPSTLKVEVLQFLVEAGLLTCSIDSLVSPQLPAAATIAVALAAAAAAAEISERHT